MQILRTFSKRIVLESVIVPQKGRHKRIGKKDTKNEKIVTKKWPKREGLPKRDQKRQWVAYPPLLAISLRQVESVFFEISRDVETHLPSRITKKTFSKS